MNVTWIAKVYKYKLAMSLERHIEPSVLHTLLYFSFIEWVWIDNRHEESSPTSIARVLGHVLWTNITETENVHIVHTYITPAIKVKEAAV